jgi:WD40 repeat protein
MLMLVACFFSPARGEERPPISFSRRIAPILVDKCIGCHNERKSEGSYSLATFELLVRGGDRGSAIEPGKPEESVLSQMLHGTEEPAMPFETDRLAEQEIADFDQWIREGATFDGKEPGVLIRDLVLPTGVVSAKPDIPPPITALAFRPDGQVLAVSGYHEITFWEPATGKFLSRLPTRSERIQSLAWNTDGSLLLYAGGTPSRLGEVVLVNESDRTVARVLHQGNDLTLAALFRPSGSHVAGAGTDRIFRVWETQTGKEIASVENHADWILGLAYTPDGTKLLSASRDRSVKVWDQEKQEPMVTFSKHTDAATGVAVSPDNTLAVSVGNDKILRIWKVDGSAEQVREVGGHGETIQQVRWLAQKNILLTAGHDKRVVAWNPADGAVLRDYPGMTDVVYSLAVTSDESRLAVGSFDGRVRVYQIDNAELVKEFLASAPIAVEAVSAGNP